MELTTKKTDEQITKEVQEKLRSMGFRFCEKNPDYDGPTLEHPAVFGVLSLATTIQWGGEVPWYVHEGRLYFTLAQNEPSVDLTKEFWYDEVLQMYVASMLDCYDALPYAHKEK